MGDFRASIKIEFEMGGVKKKQEWWINWSPEDDGVDRRITEWISEAAEEGEARIRESMYRDEREAEKRRNEQAERDEYERLKLKFGYDKKEPKS